MNKQGEIILIEDDLDDQEIFQQVYRELEIPNKPVIFQNGHIAYEYLNNTNKDPFFIISDINMPVMTGIELRDKMQQVGEVRLRTVPFLFMTTSTAPNNIIYAYSHSVQGFFPKPKTYLEFKTTIRYIFDYWKTCMPPTYSNIPPECT